MVQSFRDKNNIAVVGGGPAGIFFVMSLLTLLEDISHESFSITVFEKNIPLATLLPTGNGRCNITNSITDIKDFASNYPRGEKFLYSIFSRFSNTDTLDFLANLGIKTYTQPDGRVFPITNSAADIRNKFLRFIKKFKNVNFIKNNITNIAKLSDFDYIIVSAGSRGTVKLIESSGHTCIPFRKSLCPLIVENFAYPSGVSVNSVDGDFIFTKSGISGPLAFKISSLNAFEKFPYVAEINLFDSDNLIKDRELNPKKSVGNIVSKYIPKSLAKVIIKDFSKNISEVSSKDLVSYSKLKLKIIGTESKGEIVNAGGVELSEIDKNCKSKIVNNLWFCGEILNIDGYCGGFNLQNCWSTAYIVANNIANLIMNNIS